MFRLFALIFITLLLGLNLLAHFNFVTPARAQLAQLGYFIPEQKIVSRSISLDERVPGGGRMSDIMAQNILLNVAYLEGFNFENKNVDWSKVVREKEVSFKLKPGEVFAFHQDVLDKYKDNVAITTRANFNASQGFLNDGYLMGDGVCHLASVINWVAKDAGLYTEVPKNHNFTLIPGVPKEYGVSIYFTPGNKESNELQNLYIKNTKDYPVEFKITVKGMDLETAVYRI